VVPLAFVIPSVRQPLACAVANARAVHQPGVRLLPILAASVALGCKVAPAPGSAVAFVASVALGALARGSERVQAPALLLRGLRTSAPDVRCASSIPVPMTPDQTGRARRAVAVATLCLLAGTLQSALAGALAAQRLLQDGQWTERWGGHLRLHLHDLQWGLPWSELLLMLLACDAALWGAPILLTIAVRSPRWRAAGLCVLAWVAWGLAVPLAYVGRHGWIDEPRSVDVHLLCTHPVGGRPPGLFTVSSSWFAGC
jgi:hypothetical protein